MADDHSQKHAELPTCTYASDRRIFNLCLVLVGRHISGSFEISLQSNSPAVQMLDIFHSATVRHAIFCC